MPVKRRNLLPVMDTQQLQDLADALTPEAAERYAADYRRLLPSRVRRILRCLNSQNWDAALDAALSLKVSSSMIGALRMAHIGMRIENALAVDDHDAALAAGHQAAKHAAQLKAYLAGRHDAPAYTA
jgi:HPt (histidine-containing phosphotransfer) domain-containing protein